MGRAAWVRASLLGFSVAGWLGAAAPAWGQAASVVTIDNARSIVELTAGVSIQGPADVNQRPLCQQLGLPCLTPQTVPDIGVAFSGAYFATDLVGVVGEVSIYDNPWSDYGYATDCPSVGRVVPDRCSISEINHPSSALAGVKIRTGLIVKGGTRLRFFGQALGGPQWSDVGPRRTVFQPGVGLEDYLFNGFIVHVEYDYRFAPNDPRNLSTGRFVFGIGLPLGTRDR